MNQNLFNTLGDLGVTAICSEMNDIKDSIFKDWQDNPISETDYIRLRQAVDKYGIENKPNGPIVKRVDPRLIDSKYSVIVIFPDWFEIGYIRPDLSDDEYIKMATDERRNINLQAGIKD